MNIVRFTLAALLLAASASLPVGLETAAGRDAVPQDPHGISEDKLVDALSALRDRGSFVLAAKIENVEPGGNGTGIGTTVIVAGGGGGGGEPFTGPLEIWRTAEEELVLLSKDPALPRMAFYDDGDRVITRLFYEDRPPATDRVTGDLSGVLDHDRLIRAVKKAKLEPALDEERGTITFKGQLSRRLVKSSGGGMELALMSAQVLKLEAAFVLDSRHRLQSLKFTVVRSDPLAGLKRKALSGDFSGGGVSVSSEMPEPSEEEGTHSIYTLHLSDKGPSAGAKKFVKEVRTILDEEPL